MRSTDEAVGVYIFLVGCLKKAYSCIQHFGYHLRYFVSSFTMGVVSGIHFDSLELLFNLVAEKGLWYNFQIMDVLIISSYTEETSKRKKNIPSIIIFEREEGKAEHENDHKPGCS